jgi:hypothetical protein
MGEKMNARRKETTRKTKTYVGWLILKRILEK